MCFPIEAAIGLAKLLFKFPYLWVAKEPIIDGRLGEPIECGVLGGGLVEGDNGHIVGLTEFFGNDCRHPLHSSNGEDGVYEETDFFHTLLW